MQKQQRESCKKKLYHELTEINVQFVESQSDTDFPYKVQVKGKDSGPIKKAYKS